MLLCGDREWNSNSLMYRVKVTLPFYFTNALPDGVQKMLRHYLGERAIDMHYLI